MYVDPHGRGNRRGFQTGRRERVLTSTSRGAAKSADYPSYMVESAMLIEIEMWLEELTADAEALAAYRAESRAIEAAFDLSTPE